MLSMIFGEWDDDALVGPEVILVNDTLHMWYDGFKLDASGNNLKIGHAVSTNWITWQKDPANPVLHPGTDEDWCYPRVRDPRVIYFNGTFHMFYNGGFHPAYDIGYAQSKDGSDWVKYNDTTTTDIQFLNSDPVIKKGLLGNWDDDFVWTGSVLFNDNRDSLRMWHTGATNSGSYSQIGYATASFDSGTALADAFLGELPKEYVFKQNYPNPFNPSTTIEYSIPKSSNVEISVCNLSGQKLSTLANKHHTPGNYQITWNGSGYASGVYIYQIKAENFVQSKKMLLIR